MLLNLLLMNLCCKCTPQVLHLQQVGHLPVLSCQMKVELLVTYEGLRFAVSDLRLLMDTFHRVELTGTWRKLFSRVKKHIIWGVLKSVTGMQGKKFKDKAHNQKEACHAGVPNIDLNLSDSDGGSAGKSEQNPLSWPKRPAEGAGDGFVTSIKGLFNSQRRKAKAFVLRTMRGEAENEITGDWSESEAEFSPFARQLTITKAKKLIRRHIQRSSVQEDKKVYLINKENHFLHCPERPPRLKVIHQVNLLLMRISTSR